MKKIVLSVFLFLSMFTGCNTTAPVVHPTDMFYGQSYDCSDLSTRQGQEKADECALANDVTACLVSASAAIDATTLACGARDAQMLDYVKVAKGTATPDVKVRAAALRNWLINHSLTFRN